MKIKYVSIIVMMFILSSCAHPHEWQSSNVRIPSIWNRFFSHQDPRAVEPLMFNEKAEVEHEWWKHFEDETLNDLINAAVTNNKELAMAKQRVEEARANFGYGKANQLPEIDAFANPQRGNRGLSTADKPRGMVDANLQASWEIDIFGRNLPRLAQAETIMQSQEASRQAVLIGLLAEVGRNYFDLCNYQQQIEITKKNLENQKKTLELIQAQKQGALVSDFDVQRASAQVSTTESQLPSLQTAYDAALNRLNVLLGVAPGTIDAKIKPQAEFKTLDQRIIVAAPATVLANRPDVKAAERNFAASISNKQAAQKLFFPKISLLSFFGAQESNFLSAYPAWNVGLTLVQPVLDFGRIKAQIRAARAQEQQAYLRYQQTVLESLENMENVLSAYQNETIRNQSLKASVEANRKASALAQDQFKNGYTALLDVLVAQRSVLDAESAYAASQVALRKDLIAIYTAAGGGWEI